jgi:hypothetical protein
MGFSRPRYNQKARAHRSAPQQERNQNGLDHSGLESVVDHEELGFNSKPKTTHTNPQENEDRGSMSKKKRKRFEAYVQKKLKKERRNDLIQVGPPAATHWFAYLHQNTDPSGTFILYYTPWPN